MLLHVRDPIWLLLFDKIVFLLLLLIILLLLMLLQLLLIIVADIVTTADVADLVRESRLGLPIPETVGSDTDSVRVLLRRCQSRRRPARRRIMDRIAVVVVHRPSAILFRAGRLRSRMQHALLGDSAGGVVRYRHRNSASGPSPEAERHRGAARV